MKHKITGQGEPIIILRGLGRSYEYWLDFEKELSKYFKVVMINLPGMDQKGEKTPLRISKSAKLLNKKLESIENEIGKGPYNIFGLSLGGLNALALAYYFPEKVKNLIVASSGIMQFKTKRIRIIPVLKIMLLQILPFMPKSPHKLIGKYLVTSSFLKQNKEIIKIWDDLWKKQNITKINFFKQLLSAAFFSLTPSMLRNIHHQTLILSGDNDALVPPANSKLISKYLPNSAFISIPECGHDITTENPETISEIISDFCKWKNLKDIKTKYKMIKEPPEIVRLRELEQKFPDKFFLEPLDFVETDEYKSPIYAFFLSKKPDKDLPTVAFFSCFHGVEWIGANVLINFLEHFLTALAWDKGLVYLKDHINICGIPIVNPIGRIKGTRTNGKGIDLMRNAPTKYGKPSFLLGGQDFSSKLPWFMGNKLQKENRIAIDFIDKYVLPSDFKITLDLHSGFINKSRIWIPYASGKKLPKEEDSFYKKIGEQLDKLYKYHLYEYEKQTNVYRTYGDFWDFCLERHLNHKKGTYLPLTLEISSLKWTLKNFIIKWSFESLFNPVDKSEGNSEYLKHLHLMFFLLTLAKNNKTYFEED